VLGWGEEWGGRDEEGRKGVDCKGEGWRREQIVGGKERGMGG